MPLTRLDRSRYVGIKRVVEIAPRVDMEEHSGTEEQIAAAIEKYYSTAIWFDPKHQYPTGMFGYFGKDWAQNARGIYFCNDFHRPKIHDDRNLFFPSFGDIDWNSRSEEKRRRRARVAANHALNNEEWNKSEYAWKADAWSDIFGEIRDDPLLEMDKHECNAYEAETDPVRCTLTGGRSLVKRIPDATFGLSTYRRKGPKDPNQSVAFRQDKLERLLLHRKCGLIADPKWGDTKLVFPWAAYEAKGWNGDYREARRQACSAAARYLNMLDRLARRPGPTKTTTSYQTPTSHDYQVFAFTSFGAYWHILLGCRYDRPPEEHAGVEGMSKTVTVFQKVWSGRINNERNAWELISLVDQIHQYAVTHFRSFVMQHLNEWHRYCAENYLFDWDSDDEGSRTRKRKREWHEDEVMRLPRWCDFVGDAMREKFQARERNSLQAMLREEQESEDRLELIKRVFPPPE